LAAAWRPPRNCEFGHATVGIADWRLFTDVPPEIRVWASHGDFVADAPAGFRVPATSANAPVRRWRILRRAYTPCCCHPEVVHTEHGLDILRNFAYGVCGCTATDVASFVEEATARIQTQVGAGRVVCGLSGGVDRRRRHLTDPTGGGQEAVFRIDAAAQPAHDPPAPTCV